ncbi:MAG: hypothetical protein KJN64_08035 [Ignavibacteria bacterium]|nr:hypothetical protein [Ignavibacteria bacterium]
MKNLIVTLIFTGTVFALKPDSLIQIYPGIGDTLYFFDRAYISLYPEVENFKSAVFYIRDKEQFISEIHISNDDSNYVVTRIQNQRSLDSIRTIISKVDYANNLLMSEWHDITLTTTDGRVISGDLSMFDDKYIYIIAEDVRADHIGRNPYKIPYTQISTLVLEGSSNFLTGMCIGGGAGTLLGVIIALAVGEDPKTTDNSLKNCGANLGEGVSAVAIGLGIALAGVTIGAIVGASTSTDDEVITFESELDLLKLKGHAGYLLDKDSRKTINYFDIH